MLHGDVGAVINEDCFCAWFNQNEFTTAINTTVEGQTIDNIISKHETTLRGK